MKSIFKYAAVLLFLLFASSSYAETVELVVFSAKAGVSDERIVKSAEGMLDTIQKWQGFISRELIKTADGKWVDIVHWNDLEAALAAQHKAMQSDSCLLFFSLLEQNNQQIFHGDSLLIQNR